MKTYWCSMYLVWRIKMATTIWISKIYQIKRIW